MPLETSSLDTLLAAAVEIADEAERQAFVDRAAAGDNNLRAELKGMVRDYFASADLLDRPAVLSPTIDQPPAERLGMLIGPYKLLEQIGEGGMGVVYMAQQTHPVKRKVALKVIKPGMDSQQVIARFEAERQALAMMDHSHIARVLDAGTTDSGRPYFVMELVRGVAITEYCERQRLDTRARLSLFIAICHAVQHAHQKGIIHRDLKPTNVLVTLHDGEPVVKVIDFGVAKALNQELTEKTLFTQFSQMIGTPLYMSPEQAEMSGLDVDTRSDVYSLGVMLYELLTGTTPFDKDRLKNATFDEMRRIIREEEPETVSQRLAKTRSNPGVAVGRAANHGAASAPASTPHSAIRTPRLSELDWIVSRALEKDRSRRYESASALAADIQRHLAGDAVLACPPTTLYRFQKFAKKHQPALATSAALALCLILGTTVSAWQAVRATTAEAQANANAMQAQEKAAEATQQRDEVQTINRELQATQSKLRQTLYVAHVNMARHAWNAFAIDQMTDLLDQQRPKPGEADLRAFEWHYLHRQSHLEPLLTLKGHTHGVNSVAYSPDGKRIATASSGWTRQQGKSAPVGPAVKVWDAATGRELLSLPGHRGEVKDVAFSPDSKRLASAGSIWDDDNKARAVGEVIIWDAQTGQELLSFKGHKLAVHAVSFSPDGKRIASAGGNSSTPPTPGELKIWNPETGAELVNLPGHNNVITNVTFNSDGTQLATSSWDYTARIWDADTGRQLRSVGDVWGGSLAFSPDGKQLATAGRVLDLQTGKPLLDLNLFNANGLIFSPDGKRLASTAYDQPVRIYERATGKELFSFRSHTSHVNEAVFSTDGNRLALAHGDGTVRIWNATTSPEFRALGRNAGGSGLAFSPDGKRLASTGNQGILKVSDTFTGRELLSIKSHDTRGFGPGLAYSSDGKRLATAAGGSVKVWDAETGQELLLLDSGRGGRYVAFSPDGKRLASAGTDLKVWDAQSGQEAYSVKVGQVFATLALAYSPDGKRIACGGGIRQESGGVQIFDAQTGEKLQYLPEPKGGVQGVAFSPDGKRVATSSHYGAVRIWDPETAQELLSIKGHTGVVHNVVYSPDGKRLATLSQPLTIKLFDARTGQETLSLQGRHGLAFSPDGHLLASATWNGPIIYDATPLPEKP